MIIGLIFLAIAAGILLRVWLGSRRAAESRGWPTVAGTVDQVSVETIGGGEAADEYQLYVGYSYRVGDATYRADRISWAGAPRHTDRREIERQAERFRPGAPVRVYHNPGSPDEAVLEPASYDPYGRLFKLALLIAGLGVALIVAEPLILGEDAPRVAASQSQPAR